MDLETDQILGATLMHHAADEVINLVAMAMRHGMPASALHSATYKPTRRPPRPSARCSGAPAAGDGVGTQVSDRPQRGPRRLR